MIDHSERAHWFGCYITSDSVAVEWIIIAEKRERNLSLAQVVNKSMGRNQSQLSDFFLNELNEQLDKLQQRCSLKNFIRVLYW